ncbi:MAG: sugar phosphate isomerase/epimerase [Candidatus Omnitrophica bacterium]|nr:sugar phosphate isomerase/epimerase [Candidatus Omnitrophota bacterium]
MGLAISTSWNAFRHTGALSIVSEIVALNFFEIELSFNLSYEIVEQFAGLVERKKIQVVSLHNFCPYPEELPRERALPDCFSLASPNQEERKHAVQLTKRTIDTAASLAAKCVVLHLGRVEIPDYTKELILLYEQGQKDSLQFKQIRSDIQIERAQNSSIYFEQALVSLDELQEYASRKDILLAVETRFYYREIPNLEELKIILQRFRNSNVRYWHDTGHAQVMENLGFYRHLDFLEVGSQALAGMHLHNLIGCQDHQPPHKGILDFGFLVDYFSKDTLKVMEVHHPATAEEIQESKKKLEELFRAKL